jgi:serine/threonine protein kinase/tetratricopeptide (TPR) repeat protein
MSIENWQRVKELLDQAIELAPEQRAKFIDEACGSNDVLRAELESLLSVGDGISADFLQSPLSRDLKQDLDRIEATGSLVPGQLIAQRFQLIRKLGEGGMGQVWLAEQTSPVRRQVALKLIKAGMYDEAVVQRFQSERQSLAMMDHPAIAKVFDAGATPQGQPYLVMEFVPGLPITEYCDQHKLKIRERLELFIHACEGVQHAHQKAIIHRDLKPSNILVLEVDGNPMPRIIDFGLAKTTAPQLSGEFTQLGQFIGTPGYMSPEQVNLSGRDIDTRTDVYTLGVVLYVLLTGLQPFETKRREKPSLEEWLRQLREEEPPSPSTKVSGDKDTSSATAEARSTEPKQLVSLLRGDLDWITVKALERDRTHRYGTPSELAADLRRYLNHEPVMARPATPSYRLRKYIRRHQVAMSVSAVLLVMLAVFSGVQTLQLRETTRERDHAKQERDRANQERDRATRITDFMTGMFKVSDPSEARGNSVTAREILDKASNDLGKGLTQDPDVQSQMLHDMASTYTNLGLNARAHELAQRALDARLMLHGSDDPKTLESMAQLGLILHQEGHNLEAEKLEREALASERRVLGVEAPLTLETMDDLAVALKPLGRLSEAESIEREVVEVGTRTLGPENALTLRSMGHLGSVLFYEARYADAERVLRQALDIEDRIWGEDHPETLKALTMLAITIQDQGREAEAELLYRQVLITSEHVLGSQHRSTAGAMINLGSILSNEGHLVEAEKLIRDGVAVLSRIVGREHALTLTGQLNLAQVLFREGHIHDAERLQRETMAAEIRAYGPESPDTLSSRADLAETLIREGRYSEAERLARETFAIQRRTLGPQHPDTLGTLQQLTTAMAFNRHYTEASQLFRDVIDKGANHSGQGKPWTAWFRFASMAATTKHSDDAIQYLKEAIRLGFHNPERLLSDEDLKNLRSNPNFQELVVELKTKASSVQAK